MALAVTTQLQTLLQHLAEGSVQPERFSERLTKRLFPDGIREIGAEMRKLGPVQHVALLSRSVDGEKCLYRYRAGFADSSELVDVVFDKAGKIDRINFTPG